MSGEEPYPLSEAMLTQIHELDQAKLMAVYHAVSAEVKRRSDSLLVVQTIGENVDVPPEQETGKQVD